MLRLPRGVAVCGVVVVCDALSPAISMRFHSVALCGLPASRSSTRGDTSWADTLRSLSVTAAAFEAQQARGPLATAIKHNDAIHHTDAMVRVDGMLSST